MDAAKATIQIQVMINEMGIDRTRQVVSDMAARSAMLAMQLNRLTIVMGPITLPCPADTSRGSYHCVSIPVVL